ncbi:hypothetical protein CHARACLAT_020866, partial [Characodon lateralis]|nr:hypothetical protein [Characodon lateralis]
QSSFVSRRRRFSPASAALDTLYFNLWIFLPYSFYIKDVFTQKKLPTKLHQTWLPPPPSNIGAAIPPVTQRAWTDSMTSRSHLWSHPV